MARIDLKNEDFTVSVGHRTGSVTIEFNPSVTDENLKEACSKFGEIILTLDEVTELISVLKEEAKNGIVKM